MADKHEVMQELANKIIAEAEKDFLRLKEFRLNWRGLKELARYVSLRVEWASIKKKLAGADKRLLAVEIGMILIDRFVPGSYLRILPRFIIRWMLGKLIDAAVRQFNKYVGKSWGRDTIPGKKKGGRR